MVLIEDSRQQEYKHKLKNAYFREAGIKVIRSKLTWGDYQIASKGDIVVDTKKDVLELFMDLTRDHERFRDECMGAQEAGVQLIVLVEEELPGGKLANWVSPVHKSSSIFHNKGDPVTVYSPEIARKAMITMSQKYGVKFRFCSKEECGKQIIEYLTGVRA